MAARKTTTEKKDRTEGITKRQAEVVSKLLEQVEKKLGTSVKASLGDYIRLVQLQKELEEDGVREVTATWVEPEGTQEKPKQEPKESGK